MNKTAFSWVLTFCSAGIIVWVITLMAVDHRFNAFQLVILAMNIGLIAGQHIIRKRLRS